MESPIQIADLRVVQKNWQSRAISLFRPVIPFVLLLAADLSSNLQASSLRIHSRRTIGDLYLSGQDSAFQKGLVALKNDLPQQALDELTIAEREQPTDGRVRSFRGIALTRLGRNTEAASEYREAIRLDPSMEDAYRNLGFLEWHEHQLEQAIEDLKHAIQLSPGDSFAHYYLGRVQLDTQKYEGAFRELSLSGVPWPAEPDFLIAAAAGYLVLHRQLDLQQTLDRVVQMTLSSTQSVRVASLLLAAHEADKAINLLKQLRKSNTQNDSTWIQFDLALAYLVAGSYNDAVEQGRLCMERSSAGNLSASTSAASWSLIGIAYARNGESDLSISALRHASSDAPQTEEYWLNLTRELMAIDRYEDAINESKRALVANPASYALHLRLGAANLAAGHYPEAESAFHELVNAGDPLPTSYVGLAQVLLREGHTTEAVSELKDARRKLGANFLLSYFLGLALSRTANPPDAVAAFKEALQLIPESAEAHLGLAKTELASGDAVDAVTQLEETLRLNPGNVQAGHLLMQARRRTGDKHYAETTPVPQQPVEGDLLSDFILPEWKMPPEQRPDQVRLNK